MKKIVIIVLVAIVTIFVGWEIVSSWIPKFSTYQQQIKYADLFHPFYLAVYIIF